MSKASGPPTLGHWPLMFPATGTVAGILIANTVIWPLAVLLAVLGIYFGVLHRKPTYLAGVFFLLLSALLHHRSVQSKSSLTSLLHEKHELILEGTLIQSNPTGLVRHLFQLESGARLLLFDLPENHQTGQRLRLAVEPLQSFQRRNPTGWNPEKTLQKKGIAGSVRVLNSQKIAYSRGFPLLRGWSESARDDFAQRVTRGIAVRAEADIVQAVVLGRKTSRTEAFGDFRQTGTMHVFAVSGLHVGLVATLVFALGKLLRIPMRALHSLVILAMFGYAFVTGLQAPALRAALMGGLVFGRFLLLRRSSVANNLFGAGTFILLLDGFQLFQTGFQLSFWVVSIILLLEPRFWKKTAPLLAHDAFLPQVLWTPWQKATFWTRNKIGKTTTVSLAAWIGSAPLSAFYFGWFTPIAVVASLPMVFLAFLILTTAFLTLTIGGVVPPIGEELNKANAFLARTAQYSAHKMAQWPGGSAQLKRTSPWRGGICIFDFYYGGSAVHLDAGGGLLIDGGNQHDFWWTLAPAFQAYGHSFDSIIATHNDASHIGGLAPAIRNSSVKQALLPAEKEHYSLAQVASACRSRQVRTIPATVGTRLPVDGDTSFIILHAGGGDYGRADDRGLVILIVQRGWRILITGDAGYQTERALLESGQDLSADLWICGRNRMDTTGQDPFVQAVSPKVIIASEHSYPEHEQIPKSWRAWLEREEVAFYSQREHGAIFVKPSTNRLVVTGYLSKRKTVLKR